MFFTKPMPFLSSLYFFLLCYLSLCFTRDWDLPASQRGSIKRVETSCCFVESCTEKNWKTSEKKRNMWTYYRRKL